MERSTASEATCSRALLPVVSTLPFLDAPLYVDAPSTDAVAAAVSAAAAAAAAALGNGVTIPLTSAAGMMKLKVMGRALILNGNSNPSQNPSTSPATPTITIPPFRNCNPNVTLTHPPNLNPKPQLFGQGRLPSSGFACLRK